MYTASIFSQILLPPTPQASTVIPPCWANKAGIPRMDIRVFRQSDFNQRLVLFLGTTMPMVALSISVLT